MKKIFQRCSVTGLMAFGLVGGVGAAPHSAVPELRPERVLLTFSGDPSTEMAVSWRRPAPAGEGVAQITEAHPGPDFPTASICTTTAIVTRVEGVRMTNDQTTDGLLSFDYYTARLTGLNPATKYAYRVGNGREWSEWNHFSTAEGGTTGVVPAPFRFIYLGDAQNDILSKWSRVMREAFVHASDARFSLQAGDLVDRGNNDLEWDEWFEGAGWINRMVPVVAVPGNHEYSGFWRGEPRVLSKLWIPQFEYPRNGVEGLEDTNYFIDYNGLRIIGLDSNTRLEDQTKWLEGVLAENPNRWTLLTFHHPIYSTAVRRDNPKIREAWMPLVDKYGVDLVLQGHDHTYGRTSRMRGGEAVSQAKAGGAVYVVSVSGPKMYEINPDTEKTMERRAEDTQLFQVLTVEQDRLRYESRTATGKLYDAFTLIKTPDGNKFETDKGLPSERLRKSQPSRR